MSPSRQQRVAGFAGPMLIGIISAQRAADHVRTVDFVLLFFGGVAFGAGVGQLIAFYRARRSPS